MPKVLAKVNVAYPAEFDAALAAFDRSSFGETKCIVTQDDEVANLRDVVFDWTSLRDAKAFWTSRVGIEHIASWHSVEPPEFVYLRDRQND